MSTRPPNGLAGELGGVAVRRRESVIGFFASGVPTGFDLPATLPAEAAQQA